MSKNLILPQPLTLANLQAYVKQMVIARHFEQEDLRDLFLLFTEEVGELARALREKTGLKMASDTKRADLAGEFADCLLYLFDLANQTGIDLEQAIKDKEAKNNQRSWS